MSDLPPSDMPMFLQLISSDLRKLLQPVNGWSVVYAALTTAFPGPINQLHNRTSINAHQHLAGR